MGCLFSGVFSYLSYRDPNLVKTLDNYDGTVQFLRELEMDSDSLTKAIIGTIGDVDSYQLPDAKGYSRYIIKPMVFKTAIWVATSSSLQHQCLVAFSYSNGPSLTTRLPWF